MLSKANPLLFTAKHIHITHITSKFIYKIYNGEVKTCLGAFSHDATTVAPPSFLGVATVVVRPFFMGTSNSNRVKSRHGGGKSNNCCCTVKCTHYWANSVSKGDDREDIGFIFFYRGDQRRNYLVRYIVICIKISRLSFKSHTVGLE